MHSAKGSHVFKPFNKPKKKAVYENQKIDTKPIITKDDKAKRIKDGVKKFVEAANKVSFPKK